MKFKKKRKYVPVSDEMVKAQAEFDAQGMN